MCCLDVSVKLHLICCMSRVDNCPLFGHVLSIDGGFPWLLELNFTPVLSRVIFEVSRASVLLLVWCLCIYKSTSAVDLPGKTLSAFICNVVE